jgi:DNA (cytosine-5)-methyltransferase 1
LKVKKILRKKNGYEYLWSEGAIQFPDNLASPSRTIITSEGGSSASRTRHVIIDNKGYYRRLIPIELERLNLFPKNFTDHKKIYQ